MGKLNINNGGVDTNKKMPDIDERFGPYTSIEAANAALGGMGRNTITAGLTVGILTANAGVKEYWYQPNKKSGILELIPKGGNAADNPTEGNFASFDENGNVVDSGNKAADFAPMEQAVPMGDTEDVGKILEKQVSGFGWVVKPVDGDDAYHVWLDANGYDEKDHPVSEYNEYNRGKSAREIYNATYNKNLNDAEFAAELKMNYPMLHVGYNSTNAGATVGVPFNGNLNPNGDNIGASDTTIGKLYLMPDAASDPENCIGFVTVLDGQTYKWCNVGAIRIPSDVLAKTDVDNECVDGATDEPASAKAVMDLKAKLEGVTASEVKGSTNIDYNGFIVCKTTSGYTEKTYVYSSDVHTVFIPILQNIKKLRFLGRFAQSNSIITGYAFINAESQQDIENNIIVSSGGNTNDISDYIVELHPWVNNGTANNTEINVAIPDGATYFCAVYGTGNITQSNFYCYLQSGKNVSDLILDLTAEDNQVKIQETKAISDIVESTLVPTITNSKRLQYQKVGKQISTCITDSSIFEIRKYEIIPNKIYIFSGKYTNITGYIKPVCWADENDVIIKVEEQLTWTGTSTRTFIDEDIVAPSNAKYLYVNFQTSHSSYYNLKEYSPISSSELRNDIDKVVSDVEEINEVLDPHITYNVGRNLFNKNDLYTGYLINGGELQPSSNGVLSNKIYLIPNKQYTLQGIVAYGIRPWVFFGFFNSNDEFVGRFGVKVSASYATQTFTFKNSATNTNYLTIPQDYSYCRIQVKTNATSQNYDIIQIEEGNVANPVEPYTETATLDIDNVVKYTEQSLTTEEKDIARNNIGAGVRKQIRLLSIGNSYSQDALSYVPYLMKNINPDVDITIGICMLSSSYLSQHYGNFNTSFATYTFYISQNGGSWEDKGKHSIKWALSNYTWDIVLLQQSSTYSYQSYDTYYQPFLDELISSISNYQTYPIKFGWLLTQSKPAQTNGGANYSDETIISHFNSIAANSQKVYEETLCDFVIPCGTAIQNARTIESIATLGNYANNSQNTSGKGYLCYTDGVHLQEGLGCHIEALTVICKLLELSGYDYTSVIGESTLINASLISDIDVPGAHGSAIGETAANVRIAEWCAVMACKNPYEITDMNVYTAITKLVMIKDYDSHITNTTTPYIINNVGEQQSLTLNAADGYSITSVQVKMGETDITSEVYNSSTHQIVIPSVTDCVLIKARTATSSSTNPEQ